MAAGARANMDKKSKQEKKVKCLQRHRERNEKEYERICPQKPPQEVPMAADHQRQEKKDECFVPQKQSEAVPMAALEPEEPETPIDLLVIDERPLPETEEPEMPMLNLVREEKPEPEPEEQWTLVEPTLESDTEAAPVQDGTVAEEANESEMPMEPLTSEDKPMPEPEDQLSLVDSTLDSDEAPAADPEAAVAREPEAPETLVEPLVSEERPVPNHEASKTGAVVAAATTAAFGVGRGVAMPTLGSAKVPAPNLEAAAVGEDKELATPVEPLAILSEMNPVPEEEKEAPQLPAEVEKPEEFLAAINDEGVRVKTSKEHDFRRMWYCARNLGFYVIPKSNGRCGPNKGPQCASCKRFQKMADHAAKLSWPNPPAIR